MRILIVHDIGRELGGAELVVRQTKEEMEKRGHDVRVLTSESPSPTPGFADYTFRCRDASRAGKLITHLYNRAAREAVRSAIADFRPAIVHFHTVTKVSPAGVGAARGVPSLITLHDYGLLCPRLHEVLGKRDFCGLVEGACCVRHAGFLRYWFERLRIRLHRRAREDVVAVAVTPSMFLTRIANQLGFDHVVTVNNAVRTGPFLRQGSRSPGTVFFTPGVSSEPKGSSNWSALFNAFLILCPTPSCT